MHTDHLRDAISRLPVEEKVGRVFLFTFRNVPQAEQLLKLRPSGFVRLYSDALTVRRQHDELQNKCNHPLLFAADFERGVAPVVAGATEFAPAMALAAGGSVERTFSIARAIAREARAIGVNWNFMPTVDVNTERRNPIINSRAFSDEPRTVAAHAAAFISGSQQEGVATCCKHFPGHGATAADSHSDLPILDLDRATLREVHLEPFRRAIDAGVDAVMVGHLACPALDPAGGPATFSQELVRGILREQWGFQGVIVTDALDMGAIVKRYSIEESVVRAFAAGCDLLVMPPDPYRAYDALLRAVREKQIPEQRLDESVARIQRLAERYSLLSAQPLPRPALGDLPNVLASESSQELAHETALEAVTVIRDEASFLPIAPEARTAVISFTNAPEGLFEYLDPKCFADYCRAQSPNVRALHCGCLAERRYDRPDPGSDALNLARNCDVVVAGVFYRLVLAHGQLELGPDERAFLASLSILGKPMIVVLFGPPYLASDLQNFVTVICAYGTSAALQRAAAELLFGRHKFRGRLPVRL